MESHLQMVARITILAAVALAMAGLARRGRRRGSRLPRLPGPVEGAAAVAPEVADRTLSSKAGYVRPAGKEAVRDPHRRWDRVDEASDESFPASDPPGSY